MNKITPVLFKLMRLLRYGFQFFLFFFFFFLEILYRNCVILSFRDLKTSHRFLKFAILYIRDLL